MRHRFGQPRLILASGLIGMSFLACVLVMIADVGIWNTPYETTDSAGRGMGFNDPLSREHWGILLSNFRFQRLLAGEYAYSWLLLAMHGAGLGLLWRSEGMRGPRVRWFFGLQGVVFPVGWVGFVALPMMVRWVLNGTFDRESMIDVPFVALVAQPIWIATALTVLGLLWFSPATRPPPDREGHPARGPDPTGGLGTQVLPASATAGTTEPGA